MNRTEIGVIGGSGFCQMETIKNAGTVSISTPFGNPSSDILAGEISGRRVAFLSRHGIGHTLNPSEVNYRANLFALKRLGVERLISVAAVGSLREDLKPAHLVIPDQFFDNTHKREKTFFTSGIVAHVSMAEPTCPQMSGLAGRTAVGMGLNVHEGGVYLNMEGPQFSTMAESLLYRRLEFSVIGMTLAVESKLARELEMCFLPLSFVTDYDCWHQDEASVSVELVIDNLKKNAKNAEQLITDLVAAIPPERAECSCASTLENAIITDRKKIPQPVYKQLEPILKKYF